MTLKITEKTIAFCATCKSHNDHTLLHQEIVSYDEGYWEQTSWQIIKCDGCRGLSFRYNRVAEDDINEFGEYDDTTILYPLRGADVLPIEKFHSAPHLSRSIYRETINAYNNEMYVLCGAGIRAVIESICNNKHIKDGLVPALDNKGEPVLEKDGKPKMKKSKDLQGKISGLNENGLLTKMHCNALHKLRFLGNNAIHTQDAPKTKDLKLGIKIIEHTLEQLYGLEEKAEAISDPKKPKKHTFGIK